MIKRTLDLQEFKKQHGFEINYLPCKLCGCKMFLSIPVETKEYVGLETGLHDCGDVDGARATIRKSKVDFHTKHVMEDINKALSEKGITFTKSKDPLYDFEITELDLEEE